MNAFEYFEDIYGDYVNTDEYAKFKKHIGIILLASDKGVAVCGSTALNIVTRKVSKVPSDVDFVTDSNEKALTFLSEILLKIEKYRWYGQIKVQNHTNFCFKGTTTHYKLNTQFGFNVCVMVLNKPLKSFYTKFGVCVQFIDDLKEYTELASSIDGKTRELITLTEDTTQII